MTQRALSSDELQSKLVMFLTEEFGRKGDRQCVWVALCRGRGAAYDGEVRSWSRVENDVWFTATLASIEERAQEILGIAAEDASSPGRHRYTVKARGHYGGIQTHAITLIVESDQGGADELPEPTQQGQTALMMQGFHGLLRVVKDTHNSTIGQAFGIAKGATDEARELRRDNDELRRKVSDLEYKLDERHYQLKRQQREDEISDMKFGAIKQVAGIVASKFGGQAAIAAGAPSRLAILVTQFAERVTPEMSEAFEALPPEMALALAEIISVAKEEIQAGDRQRQMPHNGHNGHAPTGPGARSSNGAV
jgi:hypothetical protein